VTGTPQQEVLLPDGTRIGLISIRKGGNSIDLDEAALTAWVRVHQPGLVERYLLPGAGQSAAVVDLVAAHHPRLVGERIRPGDLKALLKQIAESGGSVVDPGTGEASTVATVTPRPPSGRFSYRPAPDAHARIVAEWRNGALAGVDLGLLALPADALRQRASDG